MYDAYLLFLQTAVADYINKLIQSVDSNSLKHFPSEAIQQPRNVVILHLVKVTLSLELYSLSTTNSHAVTVGLMGVTSQKHPADVLSALVISNIVLLCTQHYCLI